IGPQHLQAVGVLLLLILCQAGLLIIPVKVQMKRPVNRREIIFPVAASGYLFGLLVFGAVISLQEYIHHKAYTNGVTLLSGGLGILTWGLWTVLFYLVGKKREPVRLVGSLLVPLYVGSALELLIAVPTHIVARSREYCCAGFATFLGISMGLAVMVCAFGPGVFILYYFRWKKVRRGADVNCSPETASPDQGSGASVSKGGP
ncbi:MAG: hypothetical protein ACYTFG_05580, partial [Planctomycetota bacterium]